MTDRCRHVSFCENLTDDEEEYYPPHDEAKSNCPYTKLRRRAHQLPNTLSRNYVATATHKTAQRNHTTPLPRTSATPLLRNSANKLPRASTTALPQNTATPLLQNSINPHPRSSATPLPLPPNAATPLLRNTAARNSTTPPPQKSTTSLQENSKTTPLTVNAVRDKNTQKPTAICVNMKENAASRYCSPVAENDCPYEPNDLFREKTLSTWARTYAKPRIKYDYSCQCGSPFADKRKEENADSRYASPAAENDCPYQPIDPLREKVLSTLAQTYVKPRSLYDYSSQCGIGQVAVKGKQIETDVRCSSRLLPPAENDFRYQPTDTNREKTPPWSSEATNTPLQCECCGWVQPEENQKQDETDVQCFQRSTPPAESDFRYQPTDTNREKTSPWSRVPTKTPMQCGRCGWVQTEENQKQENNACFLPTLKAWIDCATEDERDRAHDMFRPFVDGREAKCQDEYCSSYKQCHPQLDRISRVPPRPTRYDYLDSENNCASSRWLWPRKSRTVLPQTGYGMLPLRDSHPWTNTSGASVFSNTRMSCRRHYVIHPEFASERRPPRTRLCRQRMQYSDEDSTDESDC